MDTLALSQWLCHSLMAGRTASTTVSGKMLLTLSEGVNDVIRTLIVDGHRISGTVLAAVLSDEPDIEVIGVATSLEETLQNIERSDIVIVNSSLQEDIALEITRLGISANHQVKTLVMGVPESEDVILRFIEAGAAGYILKDDTMEGLIETMHAVQNDEAILPPNLAARLMNRVAELARVYEDVGGFESHLGEDLTRREQEVLDLISEGHTNQEIADALIIELGTVKNHVHNILKKLNVNSRREAALIAQMTPAARPALPMED
jgi:DNA-binding NarL/FixJ family response regulator